MRIIFLIGIISCLGSGAMAQAPSDSITLKKVLGGYFFYLNGSHITMSQAAQIMQPNVDAYKEIKAAQSAHVASIIIAAAAGFCIGTPIGQSIAGREPNWALAGVGAGLIIVSIPMNTQINRHTRSAVGFYNSGLKTGSLRDRTELRFAFSGNSVGFVLKF